MFARASGNELYEEPWDNELQVDSWEGWFRDATNPRDVEATLELEYRDGHGQRTKRVVDVRSFDDRLHGGMMIRHCRLRDATRTFRFERVELCVNANNGENITDIQRFLNVLHDEAP